MSRPTIVVGLNHTEAGGGALSHALERAAAVHGRLRVLRIIVPPTTEATDGDQGTDTRSAQARRAGDRVIETLQASNFSAPTLIHTVAGAPVAILTAASLRASVLIVGTPSSTLTRASLEQLRSTAHCSLIEVNPAGTVIHTYGPTNQFPATTAVA